MSFITNNHLGFLQLEGFVHRKEVQNDYLNLAFVAGGQCGGKIVSEFLRVGGYANIYNTCEQDLVDLKAVLEKSVQQTQYTMYKLKGYDGAAKNRDIGLQAILENVELLEEKLTSDQNLVEADFVWVVVGLGGGTGNGSVSTIAEVVSGQMRYEKRYQMQWDAEGDIVDSGKPTVGIIAVMPEKNAGHKIQLNAAQALNEIKRLHSENQIGAVLLVDNEKLKQDYLEKTENIDLQTDWVTYGNCTVAQLITELSMLTCLPGKETFDKSEILDIWSTPGFLNIGKYKLDDNWMQKIKEEHSLDKDNEVVKKLVEISFNQQSIFADGFDYDTALHGGLAIIAPPNNKIISIRESVLLKDALRSFIGSTAGVTHYGKYDNTYYGTYRQKEISHNHAIIYTLAVTRELPERINLMVQEALKDIEIAREKLDKKQTEISNINLSEIGKSTVFAQKRSLADLAKGRVPQKKTGIEISSNVSSVQQPTETLAQRAARILKEKERKENI